MEFKEQLTIFTFFFLKKKKTFFSYASEFLILQQQTHWYLWPSSMSIQPLDTDTKKFGSLIFRRYETVTRTTLFYIFLFIHFVGNFLFFSFNTLLLLKYSWLVMFACYRSVANILGWLISLQLCSRNICFDFSILVCFSVPCLSRVFFCVLFLLAPKFLIETFQIG